MEVRILHLECISGALQFELDQIRPQAMKYISGLPCLSLRRNVLVNLVK